VLLTEHHRAATLSGDPSGEGNERQLVAGAVAQALRPITPLHRVGYTRLDRAEWARLITRKRPH